MTMNRPGGKRLKPWEESGVPRPYPRSSILSGTMMPGSRLKAAGALGRIGDPGAVAPLRRLYRMENEDAQEIIREALESIQQAGLSPGP